MSDDDKPIQIKIQGTRQRPTTRRPVIRIKGQKQRFICRDCRAVLAYYLPYCLSCFGKMVEQPPRPSHLIIPEVERKQREPLLKFLVPLRGEGSERFLKKAIKRDPLVVTTDLSPQETELLADQIRELGIECQVNNGEVETEEKKFLLPPDSYVFPTVLGIKLMRALEEAVPVSAPVSRRLFGPLLHFGLLLVQKLTFSNEVQHFFPRENQEPLRQLLREAIRRGILLFQNGSKLENLESSGVGAQAYQGPDPDAGPITITRRDVSAPASMPRMYRNEFQLVTRELEALADLFERTYSRLLVRLLGRAVGEEVHPIEVSTKTETYQLLKRLATEFDIMDKTIKEMMELTSL